MSSLFNTSDQPSSHDNHIYQGPQQPSPRQQLTPEQDIITNSFTDLLMSSPLDNMFQDVLHNLANEDSVDLAVDSDQCVEEPRDCVNGADLCYPNQHNGHYYSSASPDFGMVLTPDLSHLNPRFSPEPICPETNFISSSSHAKQHPVARKLIMSPLPEHLTDSFQHQYSSTTTDRKRKSSVLEDPSAEAISDCSSNSESSGVFSDIDHAVISFTMSCIQPDNKRQRLDGCQDVIPEQYQQMHLTSSPTECVSFKKPEDSPHGSSSLDGDSSNGNTPQAASSSPEEITLPEPEFLHVLSLPKPDPEMCQQPVEEICQAQQDIGKPAANSKAGKPSESHVELISRAIMESSEQRLILADIYQYIYDNYPYFQTAPRGWRNTVRYNLSTNECFIKKGRAPSGRGFYWAIHPACVEDFQKGEFNRRLARQRVQYATRVGASIQQVELQDLTKNLLDGLLLPVGSSEMPTTTASRDYQSLYDSIVISAGHKAGGISANDIMLPSPVPCRANIMALHSNTDNTFTTQQHTQSSTDHIMSRLYTLTSYTDLSMTENSRMLYQQHIHH